MWTRFFDMASGGKEKEDYHSIYIEASKETAKSIFMQRFGHDPDRITCFCCGNDYSITEGTLEDLTACDRGCEWFRGKDGNYRHDPDSGISIDEYQKTLWTLFIKSN